MKFEWDEAKNRLNIRKHEIDFEDAQDVFRSPMIIYPDDRIDYSEDRLIGIGLLRNMEVVVVFIEKENDVVRIVSARKANKHESKKFRKELRNQLGQIVPYGR